ncbi:hypothetical protein FIBSPDRAFT_1047052 [Athelia psychrophila]|uniref:Major facilitator superfamily (MFS) profile domain-containing protein n=1 Tax=Athelia psychrophila TaxID=1759441 RepID=A0A166FRV4_9AGAM|nr:hypothetical protein FIBSPDRAFT_1047052 [Fibularhizoctonia sp. CBS 109695]
MDISPLLNNYDKRVVFKVPISIATVTTKFLSGTRAQSPHLRIGLPTPTPSTEDEPNVGLSSQDVTVATIIGNVGGACAGYISQYIRRRLTIITFCLPVGCFIPLWMNPNTFSALAAGAFCI